MQDQVTTNQGEAAGSQPLPEYEEPGRPPVTQETPPEMRNATGGNGNNTALFGNEETTDFRSQWKEIQTEFIDDPRQCVQRADQLVAQTMQRLEQIFTEERQRLEGEWDRGDDVSTEDLRIALQRYRSFFDRLLSV